MGSVLAGCAKPAPVPAPAPSPSAPIPAAPGPSSQTAPTRAPLPAGPCVPGASAAILPSAPYGSGVSLQPPPPGGSAERPWFGYLSATQMDEPTAFSSGGVLGAVAMRTSGTATVDTAAFMLTGMLMPAPSPAWFDTHMQVEGITPVDRQFNTVGDFGNFDIRIPAGKEGDTFRLTFTGVLLDDGSSGDVTITFCRQMPPKATLTYKSGDQWRPFDAREPVPADAPLTVRIAFSHDMLAGSVEQSLTGPHDKTGQSQGAWITALRWVDTRTLELTADRPAPTMRFNLAAAQDRHGLFVAGGVPNLYSGEAPKVLAIDPVSGEETLLATIPPEPNGATLSPDGQRLRVISWQMGGGRDAPDVQFLLVNLADGTAQQIKADDPGWASPGSILAVHPAGPTTIDVTRQSATGPTTTEITNLPPIDSCLLSPDEKWIAVLAQSGAPADDPYIPVQFLIISLDEVAKRQTLTGEAVMYRPGKDGIQLYDPVWSPDSTRIAFTQPAKDGADLVLADLTTGALRTLAANLPGVRQGWDPVTWSPDGSKILVGPLLVDGATGEVLQRIEGAAGKPFWRSDGQWLLFSESGWNEWLEVKLYELATGKTRSLGEGVAVGWRPDGTAVVMRWAGARYRLIWGY